MKAAVFREYNKDPTKNVKIEDIDVPKIKSNEVLIKVESASYNYNDLWAIWGEPVKTPLPHISGSDIGGTVVEVGPDVQKIKVGDRVVSHSNMEEYAMNAPLVGSMTAMKGLSGDSDRPALGRICSVYPPSGSQCRQDCRQRFV